MQPRWRTRTPKSKRRAARLSAKHLISRAAGGSTSPIPAVTSWPSGASSVAVAALVFVVTCLAAASGALGESAPRTGVQTASAPFDADAEAELVSLTNQARAQNGLPPLTVDPRLTQAARQHSERMAQQSLISHQLEGEPPLLARISNEGLPSDGVSENVAFGNQGVVAAHEGLMHSPPHRRAILDPHYDVIGIGVFRQGDYLYITEDFARKLPE